MEMGMEKVGSRPAENQAEATTPTSEGQDKGTRQAARDERNRSKLRQAEQEAESLRGRLDTMIGAEVSRLLSDRISDPAMALRALEKSPADFVGKDGLVDVKAIETFVDDVVTKAPGLKRDRMPLADGRGVRNFTGKQPRGGSPGYSWHDILSADPPRSS